jgi:uncharacterized protein (DUF1778 family)
MAKTATEIAPKRLTIKLDMDEQRMLTEMADHLGMDEADTLNAILRERHAELMRSGDLIGDVA